jgi:hypothetical protein
MSESALLADRHDPVALFIEFCEEDEIEEIPNKRNLYAVWEHENCTRVPLLPTVLQGIRQTSSRQKRLA